MTPTLAERLAEFICGLTEDSVPPDVLEKTRTCLLNGLGIAYAGLHTPYHTVAAEAAQAMYPPAAEATIIATGDRTTVTGAVMANGALFHGRAQEDTCGAAHLGAVMIPLLLALIESGKAPADRLLIAMVAGYEVGGLLEERLATSTTPRGFRATTLYGVIAAAAATARLYDMPPDQTAVALNTAVSLSGGLLQSFVEGTDEWRYQVGTTAQLGWTAAELARAGSVSARSGFEGSKGLAQAFAGQPLDSAALAARLGQDWQTLRVAFKPFPVCAFNQTPVTAALDLRRTVDSASIRAVTIWMNPYECDYAGMDAKGPFKSISGTLMSIPFCIALALVQGPPTMRDMTTFDNTEVNALEQKITLKKDPSIAVLSCRIRADLMDGSHREVTFVMSPADYAYDFEDLRGRLRTLAKQEGLDPDRIDRIAAFARHPSNQTIGETLLLFRFKQTGSVTEIRTLI